MGLLLPQRQAQAEAILTVDKWFDVANSRSRYDARLERCGYGASTKAKAAQDAALQKMETLVRVTRKSTLRDPCGKKILLPFQYGVLRNIASLRGLYADLRETVPGLEYLLTSNLNQDCSENAFSQLRGMAGQNQRPNAVETRSRLRILLMAPSPLVAASCRGRAVQLETHEEFLTTETSLDNMTNNAFEGLDFPVSATRCIELRRVGNFNDLYDHKQERESLSNNHSLFRNRKNVPHGKGMCCTLTPVSKTAFCSMNNGTV